MNLISIIEDGLDAAKRFIKWLLPSSKHLLDVSLAIVNGIKNYDDKNPEVADFITKIIPGNIDDLIVAKARQYLPAVIIRWRWADNEAGKTPDQIVADGAAYIKTLPVAEQAIQLQGLWQGLSNELTQDGVSITDLQRIGQVYYDSTKSN